MLVFVGFFLILNILFTTVSGLTLESFKTQKSEKSMYEDIDLFLKNNITVDLKIRESGGNWVDDSLTTKVKTEIDFKITVETSREYFAIAILVKLPLIDNNPLFSYDWGTLGLGSSEPKPVFPIGEWTANNTDVSWAWFLVDSGWSKEMTFQATVVKTGSKTIELKVIGVKDIIEGNIDDAYDLVSITSKKQSSKTMISNHLFLLRFLNKIQKFI